MEQISIPQKVYKYRSIQSNHLEDSLQGKMYFSRPSKINANDPNDCKVNIDKGKCVQFLMGLYKCKRNCAESFYTKIEENWIQEGIAEDGTKRLGLQDTIRIACFTTIEPNSPESKNMWDEFGDGTGYCIEYEVTEDIFYPCTIVFLPVCYAMDKVYDDTDYVIEMMRYLKLKSDNGEKPQLNERFVARGYNHTLFKPSKYRNEKEWRIVIPANRYSCYFDENREDGGYKFMKQAIKKIYTRKEDKCESSLLGRIQKCADMMHIEHIRL